MTMLGYDKPDRERYIIITSKELQSWAIGNGKYKLPLNKLERNFYLSEGKSTEVKDVFDENGFGERKEALK